MGQSMKKLAIIGRADETSKQIGPIVEQIYDNIFADSNKVWSKAEFYHAVCQTFEEINKKLGGTQFRIPNVQVLKKAFGEEEHGLFFWTSHHPHLDTSPYLEENNTDKRKSITKEEFKKIFETVTLDRGFEGAGTMDLLIYIFGVPLTTLFIKQRLFPTSIQDHIFIPCVTSATVFLLAKFNKI